MADQKTRYPFGQAGRQKSVIIKEVPSSGKAMGELDQEPPEFVALTIDVTVGTAGQLLNIADKVVLIPDAMVGPGRQFFLEDFSILNTTAQAVTVTGNPTLVFEPTGATTVFATVPTQRLGASAFTQLSDRLQGANPITLGALYTNGFNVTNGGTPVGTGLAIAARVAALTGTITTIRITIFGMIQ